ncbi:hypothetical protein T01_4765 [Trichinella spiralis]|uniref:Uncharacterized protein n=1 Tax=Trichinella spiralis TaxID=6334 RepID=A0A0V1AW52_TRISP|nr:hypothetical protein T01_4765 [Trichinella spiralis]
MHTERTRKQLRTDTGHVKLLITIHYSHTVANPDYQAQTTVFLPHYVPPILAEQLLMLREWTSGMDVSGNSSSNKC